MKNWKSIVLLIVLILIIALIGVVVYGFVKKSTLTRQNPIVTMDIKDYGTVKIELYPDMAPNTVANFIKLIQNGYYDGLTFHRVVPGFMIQGGDSKGDGTGKVMLKDLYPDTSDADDKEYTIRGEFLANNFSKNTLRFERGVIGMGRADFSQLSSSLKDEGYNSAGAQFFIMVDKNSSLDGTYAGFGCVTEGMDIVDKIVALETTTETDDEGKETSTEKPVNPPVIEKMTVDTFGVDYGYPETMDAFDYTSWLMQNYGSSFNAQ